MAYDLEKRRRRSIRLKGCDYSQPGTYFVTLVTHNRTCLFGDAANGEKSMHRHAPFARLPPPLLRLHAHRLRAAARQVRHTRPC